MTQNENVVFDVKANLVTVFNAKLGEANVELTDSQKEVVTQTLLDNSVLTVDKLIDLNGFTHFELNEDTTAPVKTLLINHLIVYLYEDSRSVQAHAAEYYEYLEDNDLYEGEYSYGQYLTDNELVATFTTEQFAYAKTVEVGGLYLNALREKEDAAKRLELANATLEKIQPVITSNFISLGE